MRRCLSCSTYYNVHLKVCPKCSFAPQNINDFEAYAPELAHSNAGFKPEYFKNLSDAEVGSFWFKARNELLLWMIKKYSTNVSSFLEIGCGTGFVLSSFAKYFSHAQIYGSEIFIEGLSFAKQRVPNATFMQMDARRIPFVNEFDVIGAFDVLEHIEEDTLVMKQVYEALRPDGIFILTVPQHKWLWSDTDEQACHARRYAAHELHKKIFESGFKILHSTSFVSFLLPVMYLERMKKRTANKASNSMDELRLPRVLDTMLYYIMKTEISFMVHPVKEYFAS